MDTNRPAEVPVVVPAVVPDVVPAGGDSDIDAQFPPEAHEAWRKARDAGNELTLTRLRFHFYQRCIDEGLLVPWTLRYMDFESMISDIVRDLPGDPSELLAKFRQTQEESAREVMIMCRDQLKIQLKEQGALMNEHYNTVMKIVAEVNTPEQVKNKMAVLKEYNSTAHKLHSAAERQELMDTWPCLPLNKSHRHQATGGRKM